VQPATDWVRHVPFWGIRVSNINVFPFSGGATGARIGCGMSLFGAFMFSIKRFCRFQGVQQKISAQNGPKWPKMAQNCRIIYAHVPFWAILILKLNVLPFGGHATLCSFS